MTRKPIALPAAEIDATWDPSRGRFKPGSILARPAVLADAARPEWTRARARILELTANPPPVVHTRRRLVDGIRRLQHLARRGFLQLLERRA